MAAPGLTIASTRCKYCGEITFVAGFDMCENCLASDVHYIPVSDVADVIVCMDQLGMEQSDRDTYFSKFFVTPMQVSAAEEEVESRYQAIRAIKPYRKRYRGW